MNLCHSHWTIANVTNFIAVFSIHGVSENRSKLKDQSIHTKKNNNDPFP